MRCLGVRSSRIVTCFAVLLAATLNIAGAADWPQWLGSNRDGVWRETGLLASFPPQGPKIRWRAQIGNGYSGPAVVGDRLYVMDFQRAKDEQGESRRATRQGILGNERVLCLSTVNGQLEWSHQYDCPYTISYPTGPRTTPVVDQGRIYALGAMGDLICLDAAGGKVLWSKKLADRYQCEPPVWGFAGHPLIDGNLLYCLVGGEGSAVVAFNKQTGEEVWKGLNTNEVGYSPPMIYEIGGKRQLVIWLSEAIYGLDPGTGAQFWKHDYPQDVPPQRPAVNIVTVKKLNDMLFISSFYHGPMMLGVNSAQQTSVVWKGQSNNPVKPDGAHCLMATPTFKDGHGYAVGSLGELSCFKVDTGEQLWKSYAPIAGKKADCGTVFIVPQDDRYVMFNDQGDLILANLSPSGYTEISRAHILDPVGAARGRKIVWSHPAFANKCVFARNDQEIVCVSMAQEG